MFSVKRRGPKTHKSFAAAVLYYARERAREMRRANLGRMGGLSDRRSFSSSPSCVVSPAQNRPCDDENKQRTSTRAATSSTNNRRAEFARVIKLVFWSSAFTLPTSLSRSLSFAPSMPPLSFMPRETDRRTWQMPPTPPFAFVLHKGLLPPWPRDL